jgi:hypothetical protein
VFIGRRVGSVVIVVTIVVGFLTGINQWRQFMTVPKEIASAQELARVEEKLKETLKETATKNELARVEDRIKEQELHVRTTMHKVNNDLQSLVGSIARVPVDTRKMLDEALGPMLRNLDKTRIHVAQIATKLGIVPFDGEHRE